MKEKIDIAQSIFGQVNPNITVRAVSSKIRESDKILTEFEEDRTDGTLKLLFAVDMLDEGYHVKDLDGVIMMRPTYSPTIYTQQLGRALSVGAEKKPVIIDLVNNFDSCRIIEDFAEKMKQYKQVEGKGREHKTEGSRKGFTIIDKTQSFSDVARMIEELTHKNTIPIEQKIKLMEKFLQTGERICENTVFEGYPIGQWAVH